MAHAACHTGGMLHQPPLSRFPAHGAVSEYEPLNIPEKPHTKFIPVEECVEDVIPLIAPPVTAVTATRKMAPDPKLSVTPNKIEKRLNSKPEKFAPDPSLMVTPDKPGKTAALGIPRPDPSLCATPEQTLTAVSRINHTGARSKTRTMPVIDPDPLLTVTPEKTFPLKYMTKSNLRCDKNDTELKSKGKPKVRFDIQPSNSDKCLDTAVLDNLNCGPEKTVGSKAYQPRLYAGGDNGVEEDFFIDEQPTTLKYTITRHSDNLAQTAQTQIIDTSEPGQKTTSHKREHAFKLKSSTNQEELPRTVDTLVASNKSDEIPDFVMSRHNKSPKRKVVVTREQQDRPVITEYQYPFRADDDDGDGEMEHVFSRPEYNNTLKVYGEMKNIGGMVPDVDTALRKQLEESEETRTEIGEKAASRVNQDFCASQYTGLVGVEAPLADLCEKTEREMTLKAKITKPRPKKTLHRNEPDLMEFFSADLQKEAPDFQLLGNDVPAEVLSTAPQHLAFDLYRHNRVWEGLP